MSLSLKRTQGDIKNFLHVFVMKIAKTAEPDTTSKSLNPA